MDSSAYPVEEGDVGGYANRAYATFTAATTALGLTFTPNNITLVKGKTYKLIVEVFHLIGGGVKIDENGISETFKTFGTHERIITPSANTSLNFKALKKDFNFYQTQTLVINGVTTFDREAFDNSGAGVMIQNVAYVQTEDGVEIDYNSGGLRPIGANISYKHMSQLTEEEAGEVPLVTRTPGKYLLSVVGTKSVTEYHGGSSYRTHNLVAGKIEKPNAGKKPFAVPPNFSGYNLGTLLPPMKELFIQIQKFTDGLRSLAAGTLDTINRIYEFLNDIIKELKKFVAIIQKILKLFTDGLPAAGVYSLLIPSTSGGNNAIIKALKSAAGRPPNSLDFSMGLMFVGGAAAIDPLLLLLGSGGGAGGTAESRLE